MALYRHVVSFEKGQPVETVVPMSLEEEAATRAEWEANDQKRLADEEAAAIKAATPVTVLDKLAELGIDPEELKAALGIGVSAEVGVKTP